MLGNHAASATGICSANADEILWNKIYEKLNASPIPNDNPIPPFTFLDDNDAPIIVRIKAANDIAIRLWYSISKLWMLAIPLSFCLSI